MSAISEFFFSAHPSVVQWQCVEITHPAFTTLRFVRNAVAGIKVNHEGSIGPFNYAFLPMQIRTLGTTNSLDQCMEFTLGDVGQILPTLIDQVAAANRFITKPELNYREYRSDDYTVDDDGNQIYQNPMFGPFTLQIDGLTFNETGCVFKAVPKAFNKSRTGEIYDVGRFPMLKAFI